MAREADRTEIDKLGGFVEGLKIPYPITPALMEKLNELHLSGEAIHITMLKGQGRDRVQRIFDEWSELDPYPEVNYLVFSCEEGSGCQD